MTNRRHVLLTGASRGLGRAIAEHLLRAGDVVIGCSRGEPMPVEHERYTHVPVDVADETSVRSLFDLIRTRFGRLDAVINNAGTARMGPIALTPISTARRLLEVNFMGTFTVTHQAIGLLRASREGRIVNLTSVAVPLRLEGEAAYAAAKAAIESFTRTSARELGPMRITCNAIGPSPIRTALLANVPDDKLEKLVRRQAVPRWAEPSDVVNVVDFFLRPESSMVTGQVVYLGGFG